MKYVYGKRINTLKDRLLSGFAAAVLLASNSAIALPILLTQRASAIVPYTQGFETGIEGWNSGAGFGAIARVASGTDGISSAAGDNHAVVTDITSGPYTNFNGRSSVWTGTWTTEVDVYLDPSWTTGNGFEYTVAANNKSGTHLRDFIFHVTKDTSTGNLIVAGSNNAAPAPRQDLETLNHHIVTTAGWYTLRHTFRDQAGALAVDLQLLNSSHAVLFTETRSEPTDLIASVVGGNRYGWFTDITLPGGLAIDNVSLNGFAAPVVNVNTNEEFMTIKAAVQDADTLNGHTIEINGALVITDNTNINKDITIRGNAGASITTSGNTSLFTITANGVTIDNLSFVKTDKTDNHNLIGIQADDVTIENNSFVGQFVNGDAQVSRALVVSNGADNLTVSNNHFSALRQPAYLNNSATGSILNNHVEGTRGWVVEKNTDFTFSGNTWSNNAVDIAIIQGSNPALANNYTCRINAIKAANNNASVDDQAPAPLESCPNTPPNVSFTSPTPAENAHVGDIVTGHVLATDDHGMGSYYIRFWKDAFEIAGGGTYLHGCQAAPGAFLLGTNQDVSCDFDTSGLPEGTKIVLSAQFLDGHIVWGQALRTFYVDNLAPAAPTNLTWTPNGGSAMGSGGVTNIQKGTLGWQTSDSDVSHYKYYFWTDIPGYYEGQANAWTTEGSAYITSSPSGGSIWTDFYDKQGTYFFCVQAIDASGNSSPCSETFSITYDTTAPDIPVLLSPANGIPINGSSPTVNDWQAVAGAAYYTYQSYNVDGSGNCNLSSIRWTEDYTDSQTNSRILADGLKYCWRVKAIDAAGNQSGWSELWMTIVDNSGPSIPVITSPAQEQYFNTTPILNKWTASTDASGVAGYQIAYRYDDGHAFGGSTCPGEFIDGLAVSGCRDTTSTQRNHTPGLIEQGGVTIWVRAIDTVGNYSDWSEPVHYYYDAVPPAAPTISVSTTSGDVLISGGATNSYGIITSWPAVQGATGYEYRYFNSIPGNAYNEPAYYLVQTPATLMSGVFNQGEGLHHLQVRAVDAAGNWSGWSDIFNIIYDITPPALALHAVPTNSSTTRTISGTTDPYAEVSVTVHSTPQTKSTIADEHGNWSILFTDLESGDHTVNATSTDSAGNTTTASGNFTVSEVAGASTDIPSNTDSQRGNSQGVLGASTDNTGGGGAGQVLAASTGLARTGQPYVINLLIALAILGIVCSIGYQDRRRKSE